MTPDFIFQVADSSSINFDEISFTAINDCIKYALRIDTTNKSFDLKKPTVFIGEVTQQKIDTCGKIIQLQKYLFAASKQFKDKNIVGVIIADGDNQQNQLEVISELIPVCLQPQDSIIRRCYDRGSLIIAYSTNNPILILKTLQSEAGFTIYNQAKTSIQKDQAVRYMRGDPIPQQITNEFTEAIKRFNTYSQMMKNKLKDEKTQIDIVLKKELKRCENPYSNRWGMGQALKEKWRK